MTERDLWRERRARWRLSAESKIRTAADAAAFLADVGLCLMDSPPTALVLPTFAGACGAEDGSPAAPQAAHEPQNSPAREFVPPMLRERSAFEAPFGEDNILLLSPEVFPYFYAVAGEREPARALEPPSARQPRSQLVRDAFRLIHQHGVMSKQSLREHLGAQVSEVATDRVLRELWQRLLIARVDHKPAEGALWDTLGHWAPEVAKQAAGISLAEGLSAVLSKYLDAAIAAEQAAIEALFSDFSSRARIREALQALLAAREVSFVQVGRKTMLQVKQPEARNEETRTRVRS